MRIKNKWYKELWFSICEKLFSDRYFYRYGDGSLTELSPVTKEAKRHMKKVHKEKGFDPFNKEFLTKVAEDTAKLKKANLKKWSKTKGRPR